jgi:signal peptidase II
MIKSKVLRSFIIFCILIVNIGCDQISKNIVRQRIDDYEQIALVKNYVTLMKVENTGAFLSLGSSLPDAMRFALLSVLPLFILGVGLGILFLKTNMPRYMVLGFACVIGGGIGNIYDRVVHGSVTDFLHIDFGFFQTGVFNMADVSVLTGVLIVLINSYLEKEKLNQQEAHDS